ncbi:Rrf2 family transcriptional regulator [Polaribacter sp. Q13]|uniref:RrF2 family transcriptional regulator n=1 Tax=Polaribacter sp. Q13 TaxID=2806551 RepID=UPI00193B9F32|nr:Rrf2 family transcriptional regulator [Polaribacter sp. Q13]QVY66456.1 Rrf2 family transcriptional regulator [Polaribacter sp. Q13]
MLSNSSKYAIRAVLYLTEKASKDLKIGSKKIAEDLIMPAPFLAKTLQELTKKNIISSVKGPHGGFYLSETDEKNSLFDIIECIDGADKFNDCYLGQLECSDTNPCVVHHLYVPFKNKLISKLKKKTILEMSIEYAENKNIINTL